MFCLTDSAPLLVRGRGWRDRGGSCRRSLLGVLLISGGLGGGGGFGGCCPCCVNGVLDGIQFLRRFVAGIYGALTMTVVVFFGPFQLPFDPF